VPPEEPVIRELAEVGIITKGSAVGISPIENTRRKWSREDQERLKKVISQMEHDLSSQNGGLKIPTYGPDGAPFPFASTVKNDVTGKQYWDFLAGFLNGRMIVLQSGCDQDNPETNVNIDHLLLILVFWWLDPKGRKAELFGIGDLITTKHQHPCRLAFGHKYHGYWTGTTYVARYMTTGWSTDKPTTFKEFSPQNCNILPQPACCKSSALSIHSGLN
jgi:hypothetical protein